MTLPPVERDGLPPAERGLALISTGVGTFTTTLDYGLMSVALPTIALAFGVTAAQAIWVITAYQLANTSTLLLFAALGDSIGLRRIYLSALLGSIVSTAGSALAPGLVILILMRMLQGILTSVNMVLAAPVNRMLYPRAMLVRAIANNALFVSAGAAAGPTVGGLILGFAPWQTLFWINVPLLVVALYYGVRYLPRDAGSGKPIDVLSVVLGAIGICTTVYGLGDIARHHAILPVLGFLGTGLTVLTIFLRRQIRLPNPLLAVDLLRTPSVGATVLTCASTYVAYGAAIVTVPFYFQRVLGFSPTATGLLMVSWPIATVVMTRVVGSLARRVKPILLECLGLLSTTFGLVIFATAGAHVAVLIAAGVICGCGLGVFQVLNSYAIVGATRPGETGRATGIITTVRTSCYGLGAALVASSFAAFGVGASGLWIAVAAASIGAATALARATIGARWA